MNQELEELRRQVRLLQDIAVQHRAALEAQDLVLLQTLRLACRQPAVQAIYRTLLDGMTAGLRRAEHAPDALPEVLRDKALDAGLAHVAMYREAVEGAR